MLVHPPDAMLIPADMAIRPRLLSSNSTNTYLMMHAPHGWIAPQCISQASSVPAMPKPALKPNNKHSRHNKAGQLLGTYTAPDTRSSA
jgi:hypothetical protein